MGYRFLIFGLLMFIACIAGQVEAQHFVTDGLVSFWTFDRNSIDGNVVEDVWGNNDGKILGAQVVEGKINEALDFDGASTMVTIPYDPIFDIPDATTVEAWIKLRVWSVGDRHSIMTKYDQNQAKRYLQFAVRPTTSLSVFFGHSNGSTYIEGSMDVESPEWEGEWVHAAASWSKTDGLPRVYVNGQEAAGYSVQTVWADVLSTNDLPWTIGAMPDFARYFDGAIDEVRIYNRQLSAAEIMRNFEVKSNSIAVQPAGKLAATWSKVKSSF